jgi:hemolysin activation/secretion protein
MFAMVLCPVYAAPPIPPDAGQTLRQFVLPPEAPRESPRFDLSAPLPEGVAPGGTEIEVLQLVVEGNEVFGADELLALLGDYQGRSFDLAGLNGLARRITEHYRANGYLFARALVPAQTIEGGLVRLQVIEGRYGAIQPGGDPRYGRAAKRFLEVLKPGTPITAEGLNRPLLLLSDLPGIKVTPVVGPGEAPGTGDLTVEVSRDRRFQGEAGFDNHGNRYSGRNRGFVQLTANSPFLMGDRIDLNIIGTGQNLWLGSIGYSLPVGGSGLRANGRYTHTRYQLGKDFEVLDASGLAKITSLGLTYPLLRSTRSNLTLGVSYQHKRMTDKKGLFLDSTEKKWSDALPLSLQFDHRDDLLGGGITYGAFSWTHGDLHLGSMLKPDPLETDGAFDKLNLDLVRFQNLRWKLSLYGRLSVQWTPDNLDSSEDFGLGGADGVRAYPTSEGFGDRGWLGQLELRYKPHEVIEPFLFYDTGASRLNTNPIFEGDNRRRISGAGVGARAGYQGVNLEVAASWHVEGGNPRADTKQHIPEAWFRVSYSF